MKIVVKVRLLVDDTSAKQLVATMQAFNASCNEIADVCFAGKITSKYIVQKRVYRHIREKYGLSAQLAIRAIAKVCAAFKLNKKVKPTFKQQGSITYDSRVLTFKKLDTTHPQVSLTTLEGRKLFDLKIADYFTNRLADIGGQVDLVHRQGKFFLHAICDVAEDTTFSPIDVLGVDLGVKNIAVDSSGRIFSSTKIEAVRKRVSNHRAALQRKATKNAKRRLKKVAGRENRFRTNFNHFLSKYLVEKAKDSKCAIALEDLSGINTCITVRKSQRAERFSWAFYQLRTFITYKATLAGVPVVLVDPSYTSQKCSECRHIEKANRPKQDKFCCKACAYTSHADYNAAKNIRYKGLLSTRLLVSATAPTKSVELEC